jgi:hypothetical protein
MNDVNIWEENVPDRGRAGMKPWSKQEASQARRGSCDGGRGIEGGPGNGRVASLLRKLSVN